MAMSKKIFLTSSLLSPELGFRVGSPGQWSPWSSLAPVAPSAGPRPGSLRATAAALTAPEGYSKAFTELVAAAGQGSAMKLSWEGFVPDGRALRPSHTTQTSV